MKRFRFAKHFCLNMSIDFVCDYNFLIKTIFFSIIKDNVEARLYMDSQCVFYKKPLFEGGTLGTKVMFIEFLSLVFFKKYYRQVCHTGKLTLIVHLH